MIFREASYVIVKSVVTTIYQIGHNNFSKKFLKTNIRTRMEISRNFYEITSIKLTNLIMKITEKTKLMVKITEL